METFELLTGIWTRLEHFDALFDHLGTALDHLVTPYMTYLGSIVNVVVVLKRQLLVDSEVKSMTRILRS